MAFDIPATTAIPEDVGSIGVGGRNSWGRTGYGGPCPPSGVHRYVFRVYALSGDLGLSEGATKADIMAAMEALLLGEGRLIGRYGR